MASEEKVPAALKPVYDTIVAQTDAVSAEYLSEEYAALARKMAATLARKRPSPLLKGKPNSWAAGILYALGRANFLFDQSQAPHMRADELCAVCGVGKSTGPNKAKEIEEALKISWFSPDWMLPSRMMDNPMVWMLKVNGLIVDARTLPLEVQQELHRQGYIPFVPALGPNGGKE